MRSVFVFFPFDLFGTGGCAAGADLLAAELAEILADNRRETAPSRARAYTDAVTIKQLSLGNLTELADWRAKGRRVATQILRSDDFLFWISGNHLGVLPVHDAIARRRAAGHRDLIVQFDAHLDIHQFADCTRELSHGNFLLHVERPGPLLVNVGHREQLLTRPDIERVFAGNFEAAQVVRDPAGVLAAVQTLAGEAEAIYFDLDCDVLDPAFFPAVGQPVPFGLSPQQLLMLMEALWSDRVRGFLVSEFDPARDDQDRSLAILTWLLERLLLRIHESPAATSGR